MTISERLRQLDKLKNWLDGLRPFPPAVVAELKKLYDVRFTYHSNAIEGNTLTQSETEMVLDHGVTIGGKTLAEHLEVIGHKEAIDYIEELANQKTTIGEREIKDLHSLIRRGIDRNEAGRYRTLDVRAVGTEHIYPSHIQLRELMENFVEWLNSSDAAMLHPVVLASETHYRFVSIHPFRDGNGRVGRLIMNLSLLRHGYPIAVITNERRKEYIDALVYAQNHQDDTNALFELIAETSKGSLIDYLRTLSTTEESGAHDMPYYQEMSEMLMNG